jgi:hypothetical protein
MASYWLNKEDERTLSRCLTCDAIVFSEIGCAGRGDANTVCLCGMTMADLPIEGGNYFDLIMRIGHPKPAARPRLAHPRSTKWC